MRTRNKMLTTTITRAAFAEKMRQVAEEGYFVEYKRVNEYWSGRIAGLKLPTEMVFLVGASPYRFTAISVEEIGLTAIPDYAREIVSDIHGGEFVYAILQADNRRSRSCARKTASNDGVLIDAVLRRRRGRRFTAKYVNAISGTWAGQTTSGCTNAFLSVCTGSHLRTGRKCLSGMGCPPQWRSLYR